MIWLEVKRKGEFKIERVDLVAVFLVEVGWVGFTGGRV
jgi:hypothetical protein